MANNLFKKALDFAKERSQTTIPAVLQPIRDTGNAAGDVFASLRPNSTGTQWAAMDPQEKVAALAKAAISYGGEGAARGGLNGVANAVSVSPPGQLAQYSMGMPDPKKQAAHGIQAAVMAATLGKLLQPEAVGKTYLRNQIGQFSPKEVKWVTDLMGGIQ